MAKKIHIFTDCDLDGAGSYLLFSWLTGRTDIPYTSTTVNKLENALVGWSETQSIDDYDNVYVFDLDTDSKKIHSIIDRSNVYVFDHHKSNDNNVEYQNAKLIVDSEATSTCKLLYSKFKSRLTDMLSTEQKMIVSLVDDYDSYQLKTPLSKQLNTVFWSYQGDRIQKFTRDFQNGFQGFNKFHTNIINKKQHELNELISSLDIFRGTIPVGDQDIKVAGTMATTQINDVADHVASLGDSDAVFVVNTRSGKVSFRTNHTDKTTALSVAQSMTDECGGHEAAAGGMLCDKFMSICKELEVSK